MQFFTSLVNNISWLLRTPAATTPVTPSLPTTPVEEPPPHRTRPAWQQVPVAAYENTDFAEPLVEVERPPPKQPVEMLAAPVVLSREDRMEAKEICRNLTTPGLIEQFSVAKEMQSMTAPVKACFIQLAATVERELLDSGRSLPLSKPKIATLLLGEALSAAAAGRNPAAAQSLLENLRKEWAGGQTFVVKTDHGFVGEAFHIMVAAQLRYGRALTFKVPDVAGQNNYAANFDNMVVAQNEGAPALSRAQVGDVTDMSKKDLTALIVGGPTALVVPPPVADIQGGVYAMLTGGLTAETRREIGERSVAMLVSAGMPAEEPKLGIVIRNVKQGGSGTADTSNNMTRQRMLDCLNAAKEAGIRNIVFFGDALDPAWIKGTPWDPAVVTPDEKYRSANLTMAWNSAAATSPLHDMGKGLGARQHLSNAQWVEPPPHGSPALQGGYAEQLCMYHELHQAANLVALVGNRSGAIDGPAFCGVPTIQVLVQEAEGEKVASRLGLLPAIFPKYGLLHVRSTGRADGHPAGTIPLSQANLADLKNRIVRLGGNSQQGASAQ